MFFGVFIFMYLSLEHSVANSVLFSIGIFQDLARGTSHVHGIPALINIAIALIGNFIQTAAAEEGMPYQTLISSIIHKYAAGTLIDRKSLVVSEAPAPYKVSADKKTK